MNRFLVIVSCALVLASCKGNANNVVLSSLDRSAKIQLLCADLELITGNLFDLRQVLPAEVCVTETVFAPQVEAQFLGAVTQTQTGEVAVVSFTRSAILDTNRTVPGVTALRVGEQPTGIQISPFEPTYTYVSSFSPKSVQAIPTEAVITGDSASPTQQVRFEAAPTDLALHELASVGEITRDQEDRVTGATGDITYRFLYAAIPELGQIAQIPVITTPSPDGMSNVHGSLGTPQFIPLTTMTATRSRRCLRLRRTKMTTIAFVPKISRVARVGSSRRSRRPQPASTGRTPGRAQSHSPSITVSRRIRPTMSCSSPTPISR